MLPDFRLTFTALRCYLEWNSTILLIVQTLGLLVVLVFEIKNYVVSFYIKMMKRRTLHVCILRHSSRKGMFSV